VAKAGTGVSIGSASGIKLDPLHYFKGEIAKAVIGDDVN